MLIPGKKGIIKIIACLLAALMLTGVLIGCGESDQPNDITPDTASDTGDATGQSSETDRPGEETETGSQTETEDETEIENGLKIDLTFSILRSGSASSSLYSKAADYIKTALEKLFGVNLKVNSDKLSAGEVPSPNEHVILIGETNRQASAKELYGRRAADYLYSVPDENTIVIGGFQADTLLEAAKLFCKDAFGYTEDSQGKGKLVPVGMKKIVEADSSTYQVKSLKLNGIDAKDLKIFVTGTSNEYAAAAKKITNVISKWTGYVVPVAEAGTDTSTPAIRLKAGVGDLFYSIEKKDGSVYITAPTGSLSTAAAKFVSLYLSTTTPKSAMTININDDPTVVYNVGDAEHNALQLVKEERQQIKPGISFVKLTYKNRNGKPVIANAVIVEKGAGEFFLGTPEGLPEQSSLQAPLEMARDAEARFADIDVVAVVNGDQFGNYYPLGPAYQNGVKLASQTGLTPHCFAMMMDGSYYVGVPGSIKDKTKIWQLVGGNGLILQNGKAVRNGTADWFTVTHPRTALGYDDAGRFYILEIDGRQANVSNGASFIDMAVVFQYLGATNAVNVDGGGSSIMYIENDKGELTLVSSPSDGRPRLVVNSVFVVTKKES